MSLNNQLIIYGVTLFVLVMMAILFRLIIRRRRSRLTLESRWKEIQKLLASHTTWKDAVVKADGMLDDVLKRRHYKGKTMGERLVSAQHQLTANDMVWFSHKLRNKLVHEDVTVTKSDVKRCLLGFWRALKDLGAFNKDGE